jgi:hypothetical protein
MDVELSPSSGKGQPLPSSDDDEAHHTDSHAKAARISDPPVVPQSGNLDPEEYQHAKKKLKRAVLEHYQWVSKRLCLTKCQH